MLNRLAFTSCHIALLIIFTSQSLADLAISLTPSSPTLVEGTDGYVDVFVNGLTEVDALDGFLAELNIVGGGGLRFDATQTESHLSDSNYVFHGRSNSIFTGNATTSVNSASQMTLGDVSDDGSAAPLPGSPNPFDDWVVGSPRLLGRLNIQSLLG